MPEFINQFFIDVDTIPKTFPGFVQLSFLGAIYGYALFYASHMIKDGSELLLLVPSLAGVVGSIVLPILGAVPDGAIVIFSGLGENAQEEVSVGVGALAGSTIMLLTVPWMLSLLAGRVVMDADGSPQYQRPSGWPRGVRWSKLPSGTSLLNSGVRCGPTIRRSAVLMLITLIPYLVIQIPSTIGGCMWAARFDECKTPKWAPLIGAVLAAAMFAYYLYFQVQQADDDPVRMDKVDVLRREALRRHLVSLRGLISSGVGDAFAAAVGSHSHGGGDVPMDPMNDRFRRCVRPFFDSFDTDGSGFIETAEFGAVLARLGEQPSAEQIDDVVRTADANGDGRICFDEFCVAVVAMLSDEDYVERAVRGHSQLAAKEQAALLHATAAAAGTTAKEALPLFGGDQRKPSDYAAVAGRREGGNGDDGEELRRVGGSSSAASASYRADDTMDGDGGGDDGSDSTDDGGGEDEEVSMPDDLAHLSPAEQQSRLIRRSFLTMGAGVAIVLIFSDPMVDVMTAMGEHTGIKPFYIAFVLAPLASNASEVIASYSYALKKTERTITISFSSLIGAACMNNTFCLSLFLALVYLRGLEWAFTAETISIIVIEVFMFFVALRRVHAAWTGFVVLALFPLSIGLVAGLEAIGFD